MVGQDVCHGVTIQFAYNLAEALKRLGHEVYTYDGKYGERLNQTQFMAKKWTAIIGFQQIALEQDWVRKLPCLKLQFVMDHPGSLAGICYNYNNDNNSYLLCLDRDYVKYAQMYRNSENALYFPPAGNRFEYTEENKIYDVQFIGRYYASTIEQETDKFKLAFYEYMLNHVSLDYTTAMQYFLSSIDIYPSPEEFDTIIHSCWPACKNAICYVKYMVIHSLIKEGIKVHVYGNSWKNFESRYRDNLVIHEPVRAELAPAEYAKAKIGLNVMSWHKRGLTERVVQIMLSGAVCLSDETEILREQFNDGEDICIFKATDIPAMVGRVKELLQNDEKRMEIARKGYEKAVNEHTWDVRAKQLVELVEKINFTQ